jgi:hypothetical protein
MPYFHGFTSPSLVKPLVIYVPILARMASSKPQLGRRTQMRGRKSGAGRRDPPNPSASRYHNPHSTIRPAPHSLTVLATVEGGGGA